MGVTRSRGSTRTGLCRWIECNKLRTAASASGVNRDTGLASSETESHDDPLDSASEKELVVGFWTLVLLLKLIVVLAGIVVLLLLFTEFYVVAAAVTLLTIGLTLRWIRMYRSTRP